MQPPNRTYRMKSGQRIVAIVLLAVGVLFTVGFWYGVLTGIRDAKFVEMMSPVAFSLVVALFTVRAFRNRIRVSNGGVELHGMSGIKNLPIERIKGRRRYFSPGDSEAPGEWHLVLESNDDRFAKLDFEEWYRFDAEFYAWFNSLPDLDGMDKTAPKTSTFGLV